MTPHSSISIVLLIRITHLVCSIPLSPDSNAELFEGGSSEQALRTASFYNKIFILIKKTGKNNIIEMKVLQDLINKKTRIHTKKAKISDKIQKPNSSMDQLLVPSHARRKV